MPIVFGVGLCSNDSCNVGDGDGIGLGVGVGKGDWLGVRDGEIESEVLKKMFAVELRE